MYIYQITQAYSTVSMFGISTFRDWLWWIIDTFYYLLTCYLLNNLLYIYMLCLFIYQLSYFFRVRYVTLFQFMLGY